MPGAPIMHFSLVVNPSTGNVTGFVEITRALAPPHGKIIVHNLTGQIHETGFGKAERIIALVGTFPVSAIPPAIGLYFEKFSAIIVIEKNSHGHGSFTDGSQHIKNVPLHIEGK